MENRYLSELRREIEPLRQQLIGHPVYQSIHDLEGLRVFMEHHVYAVWDFMSLLKALQRGLTCVDSPWLPRGSADTRYLINEIVTGEESDVDAAGRRISHFELYLEAMEEAGAQTSAIRNLTARIAMGTPAEGAVHNPDIPSSARHFMDHTFRTIATGELHAMAAVFTFGREDLIPDIFPEMIRQLQSAFPGRVDKMHYYIQRHIEVDGGHHGALALRMVETLCGEDGEKWRDATRAVTAGLQRRVDLWDEIYAQTGTKAA